MALSILLAAMCGRTQWSPFLIYSGVIEVLVAPIGPAPFTRYPT